MQIDLAKNESCGFVILFHVAHSVTLYQLASGEEHVYFTFFFIKKEKYQTNYKLFRDFVQI